MDVTAIAKLRLYTENHNEGEGIFSSVNIFFSLLPFFFSHTAFFCCGNAKLNMPCKKSCEGDWGLVLIKKKIV